MTSLLGWLLGLGELCLYYAMLLPEISSIMLPQEPIMLTLCPWICLTTQLCKCGLLWYDFLTSMLTLLQPTTAWCSWRLSARIHLSSLLCSKVWLLYQRDALCFNPLLCSKVYQHLYVICQGLLHVACILAMCLYTLCSTSTVYTYSVQALDSV